MSRRTSVFGVALISQVVGMVVSVGLTVLRNEGMPSAADVGWSVLGGIAGGVGITSLYRGLAVGRMGIVAPVTGVLAAIIPVAAGIVLEGWPDQLVTIGIGVAIVAVVLVSRVADEGGGRAGLGLAVLAGSMIGLFSVAHRPGQRRPRVRPARRSSGPPQAVLIVGIILVTRSDWRPPRTLVLPRSGSASSTWSATALHPGRPDGRAGGRVGGVVAVPGRDRSSLAAMSCANGSPGGTPSGSVSRCWPSP